MERTQTEIPDKLFYKASEVCEITDTQPYVLRFWESEFPQLASEKNRSGQRVYRRSDIDLIFRIKRLLYQDEYTIAGARKAIDDDRTTIVEPPPVKSRARQAAPPPVEDEEEAEEIVVKPQRPADTPVQSALFGEARPEAPEVFIDPAAQQEAAQYRQMYEDALATLNDVKAELARVSGHLDAVRERDRRIAARLEAALQA
jgi:DNA-binding transcriptional MerR regulator